MADRFVTDVGGLPAGEVPKEEVKQLFWEKQMIAMFNVLWNKGIMNLDEFRRTIEQMTPEEYKNSTFYGRRVHAMAEMMIEKSNVPRGELARRTEEEFRKRRGAPW